jgi:cob(I)alamin adenosyltransferase
MNTKIYTKVGDKGETSIIGGGRVSKSNFRLEAYGTVDELSAHVGVCISHLTSIPSCASLMNTLLMTQNELFAVGSHLACADDQLRQKMPPLNPSLLSSFEKEIDQMTEELPELKDFILPGGHIAAAELHCARTICRRAERHIVTLKEQASGAESFEPIIQLLNRLGDYLFVAARFVNLKMKHKETKWSKN